MSDDLYACCGVEVEAAASRTADQYVGTDTGNEEEDVYGLRAQLEQKEHDLVLAAELGKALLEKNADLERRLEQTADELNTRIEVSPGRLYS